MSETPVVVRKIIWRDLFPWLMLLRVFRVAIAPGPLMLATGAVAICSLGWWVSGFVFLTNEEFSKSRQPNLLVNRFVPPYGAALHLQRHSDEFLPTDSSAALVPFWHLTEPVRQLFDYQTPPRRVAYNLAGFLISAAVWAFVGGVITRQALVELGCEQSYDWLDAARFVTRRYLQYFLAPIVPLIALVGMGLLVVPLGWLMNLSIGVFLAGLLWIFVIGLGLIAAWLIVGLVFGWPLMYGAIAAKRDGDALQAFSDSYSYVYGKPLHYLFYAFVALTLGGLALFVVDLFADAAKEFGFWAASWGAGGEKIATIRAQLAAAEFGQKIEAPASQRAGVWMIGQVLALVDVIKMAAAFSYFFVSAAAIFLLMRLAVDDKEMDEIHLEEEEGHLETARRAMLSDEAPASPTPRNEPAKVSPPAPAANVAFDTASPVDPPPAINITEISTPPVKPAATDDLAE